MNPTILLTGLLLLAPAAYTVADAADDDCMGPPCDQVNAVCKFLFGGLCLGRDAGPAAQAAPTTDVGCTSAVCSEIDEHACRPLLGIDCPAAGQDCVGAVCDQINRACERVAGGSCVKADAVARTDAPADCTGPVCDAINEVCTVVRGGPCVR